MDPLNGTVTVTSSSERHIALEIMSSAFPNTTDNVDFTFSKWDTTESSATAAFIGTVVFDNQDVVYDVEGKAKISLMNNEDVVTDIDFEAIIQASGETTKINLNGTAQSSGEKPKRANIRIKENSVLVSSFEIEQNAESRWDVKPTSSSKPAKEFYSYSKDAQGQSMISADFSPETTEQEVLDSFAAFATTAAGGSLALFNDGAFQQQGAQFATGFACGTALKDKRK
jgi:hypothetical protein